MSDFGFTDEPPTRPRRGRSRGAEPAGERPARRDRRVAAFFTVLAVALVAFAGWAWAGRVHEDDLAAYRFLDHQVADLDRDLLPLGRGERQPCGFTVDGWVELTWPESSGVTANQVQAVLRDAGWLTAPTAETSGTIVLQQVVSDRTLTIRLTYGHGARALVLTGTSPASSLACRLR